jgi:hypothetical protein
LRPCAITEVILCSRPHHERGFFGPSRPRDRAQSCGLTSSICATASIASLYRHRRRPSCLSTIPTSRFPLLPLKGQTLLTHQPTISQSPNHGPSVRPATRPVATTAPFEERAMATASLITRQPHRPLTGGNRRAGHLARHRPQPPPQQAQGRPVGQESRDPARLTSRFWSESAHWPLEQGVASLISTRSRLRRSRRSRDLG